MQTTGHLPGFGLVILKCKEIYLFFSYISVFKRTVVNMIFYFCTLTKIFNYR